ncbi:PAS domain S-box protein [Tepidibacillus decaturensis]|uniref:PAS domain-containing protein n=1 Tax=Tepidibacillus decaturensis TaxID=1413211 RepID=A0A135L4R6_9BACI|nr:PAS domain S-box protein [Tepidibacillus decaturensis]KXG43853.1 hypothetical protein U473_07405 [Tepidibacillus decaturensis]
MVKLNNHNSSIGFTTELTTNYRKEKVSSLKITFLYFIIANAFLLLANFVTQLKDDNTIHSILALHDFKYLIAIIFTSLFVFLFIYYNRLKLRKDELDLCMLSKIIEQSPISIIIMDENGKIEDVNPQCTQLTGYTYEEMLGKHYSIFHDSITLSQNWQGEFQSKKKMENYFGGMYLFPLSKMRRKRLLAILLRLRILQ